jgi:organic hydroperoxide reductase OsmC/OhrA
VEEVWLKNLSSNNTQYKIITSVNMNKKHHYSLTTEWTGNTGNGTSGYQAYSRKHRICIKGKQDIIGSSDPAFRGDLSLHNPEELLLASLSACHMLWYLHLCADNGIVVISYADEATGIMQENDNGSGAFAEVLLQPIVTIANPDLIAKAIELHVQANAMCFIANSVKFPVYHKPILSGV